MVPGPPPRRGGAPRAAAFAALALAGCASLRTPQLEPAEPVLAPPRWSVPPAALQPTPLARWWTAFDDDALNRRVEAALRRNTDVLEALAALARAQALRAAAEAAGAPRLDAGLSAQASRQQQLPSRDTLGAALDASWQPDLSGALRAAGAAAAADETASRALLAATRAAVATQLVLAWLDLRSARQRLAIAEDTLAVQEESLQIARWREQAGLVGSLDVEQADTAAAQTRAQLPALRSAIAQSQHAIAVLAGDVPAAPLRVRRGPAAGAAPGGGDLLFEGSGVPPPLRIVPALPAEALRRRPDVIAAEARLRATAARIDEADAARLPSLALSGSLALTLASAGSGVPWSAAALAALRLPLLDGGARRAAVQAQEAAWQQAEQQRRATLLGALREIEDLLVALQHGAEQQDELARAAAAAQRASELAEARYEAGLVDVLTVISARRTLLALRDSETLVAAQRARQSVQLVQALGGGEQP